MDPVSIGILSLVALTLFLMSGVRIAFATAMCGFFGLWILRGYDPAASLSAQTILGHIVNYNLLVLPLFIMMGFFAYYANITRDIYWAARQWLGHLPGGLAVATVVGCAGFAAACGASTASAAVMGRVALPELKKYGYNDKVSTGCVAAGGTMAIMIPPSVLMVIYGFIAEESIGALLLAGILPGLLQAASYVLMLLCRFKLDPSLGQPIRGITWSERLSSLKGIWGMIVIIVLVMGSMYTGLATPTEAAGVGAIGALAMAIPRFGIKDFFASMMETVRTTSLIFAIVAGVLIFVHFLGFTGTPAAIADGITHLNVSPTVVLVCILAFYLLLGMFIDGIGMVLLTVPIILPTIKQLGIDPIVFGILVVRMVEIGLMTPPVGLNVYVLKGVAKDVSMGDIFRGCGWFVVVDIVNVAILLAFPQIILAVPHSMIK
ncbi:MAG: TRAP transporter large permease subunit [Alphaproteobacteria bacterium]|nr:TRAP transporter large permease subunit [Alphaproteobacteria bacterium]